MTDPTAQTKKPDKARNWAIAILAGLLVALPVNYFSQSGVGYVFGVIAAAVAFLIASRR